MQYFHLEFAVTSVIRIYSKMWESWIDTSGLWSFVYSINFQIRQIPATNHHFSCEYSLLLYGQRFLKEKKSFFTVWDLVTTCKQIEKTLILPLKILQTFEGHDHWHCQCITFWVIYIFSKWVRCCWNICGNLLLSGAFLDRITPHIDFIDEAVVQCYVPVVKILL